MQRLTLLFSLIMFIGIYSCKEEDSGRMIVRLTDSPGDYEKVNIDIQQVQVHRESGNQESGWISLNTNAGIYNLLSLTDGAETVLSDSDVPSGDISQIRLVLGDANSVQIDGVVLPLTTPSAQQSGLKVIVNETLLDGITYSILLDFDAAKSVVRTGGGTYILKPVVRGVLDGKDGAVTGTINPATENVAVYAMIGEDTLGTSYAIANNANWFIGGLEAGTYSIVFDPGEFSNYLSKTIPDVSVSLGQISDTGANDLELK